jgi:hypothetical protein
VEERKKTRGQVDPIGKHEQGVQERQAEEEQEHRRRKETYYRSDRDGLPWPTKRPGAGRRKTAGKAASKTGGKTARKTPVQTAGREATYGASQAK